MAKTPPRTLVVWKDERHRDLQDDLRRFKARAIGGRLKELALLGLLAERIGFRVEMSGHGPMLAGGQPVMLAPLAGNAMPASADPQPGAEEDDLRGFDFSSQFTS